MDIRPAGDAALTGKEILRNFAFSLLLVGLSDVPNTLGTLFRAAQATLACLLFASFLLSSGRGLILLLLLAVTGADNVSTGVVTSGPAYATASIWQLNLGPVRPSWIIFLCVFLNLAKQSRLVAPPLVKTAVAWFATVPVVTGIAYGGFVSEWASIEVVKDLRFGFMLIASLVLFLTVLAGNPGFLERLVPAFVGGLLARHSVDLVYHFLNIGPMLNEEVSRVSEDSAKGGVIFLIFFGMMLVLLGRRPLLGASLSVFSLILLAAYGTRLLWITFPLGAMVLPPFLGLRRSFSLFAVLTVMLIAGAWAFAMLSPRTAEAVLARSTSITVGRELQKFAVDVPYNVISRIDPIRYGEGLNVLESLGRRFAYLWGTGYGGFYEDDVVAFPHDLKSSFPDYSLNSGIFYGTHLYSLQMMLKFGLLGLGFISALWWLPGIALYRSLRREGTLDGDAGRLMHGVRLCLVAFLPTAISQLYWSGKGLFLNGAILSMCLSLAGSRAVASSGEEKPVVIPGQRLA